MAAAFPLEPPNQDSASDSKSDKLLGTHLSIFWAHASGITGLDKMEGGIIIITRMP
jgi:hypothetical protein